MKKDTKNLISLLWVSKGYMLVGTALAVAGSALAMRGAYGEGTHAMLAGMIRLDKEKSLEIIDKVRDEKDSIDYSTARATGICCALFFVYYSGYSRLRCSANSGNIVLLIAFHHQCDDFYVAWFHGNNRLIQLRIVDLIDP